MDPTCVLKNLNWGLHAGQSKCSEPRGSVSKIQCILWHWNNIAQLWKAPVEAEALPSVYHIA